MIETQFLSSIVFSNWPSLKNEKTYLISQQDNAPTCLLHHLPCTKQRVKSQLKKQKRKENQKSCLFRFWNSISSWGFRFVRRGKGSSLSKSCLSQTYLQSRHRQSQYLLHPHLILHQLKQHLSERMIKGSLITQLTFSSNNLSNYCTRLVAVAICRRIALVC